MTVDFENETINDDGNDKEEVLPDGVKLLPRINNFMTKTLKWVVLFLLRLRQV